MARNGRTRTSLRKTPSIEYYDRLPTGRGATSATHAPTGRKAATATDSGTHNPNRRHGHD